MLASVAAARRLAAPIDGALRIVAVFIAYPWLAFVAGGVRSRPLELRSQG